MIAHYKKSTGMNDKTIREVLLPAQDVWMSGEEALQYGICDHVRDMK
jgi:ATP-dependent protease ClpP protease subunit